MSGIGVNIVSGFLGAGKTTAIIDLLMHNKTGEKWAVIVNESGKIAIDGESLRSCNRDAGIYDVTGGCICCSAKQYFGETLRQVTETGEFSRIIIEPSGLGGIDMVTETIRGIPGLDIAPVICMVDITLVDHPRFCSNPVYRAQVRKSGSVIFSKCDLVSDSSRLEELVKVFKSQFPGIKYYEPGTTLSDIINNISFNVNGYQKEYQFRGDEDEMTDSDFIRNYYSCEAERIIDLYALKSELEKFPGILRAKGHIRTENGWMLINYTLSGFSFLPCSPKEQNHLIIISDRFVYNQETLTQLEKIHL